MARGIESQLGSLLHTVPTPAQDGHRGVIRKNFQSVYDTELSLSDAMQPCDLACACRIPLKQYFLSWADRLLIAADSEFLCWQVGVLGWLEAFAAHPRIGDVEGLRKKFGGFADMSRGEQASAAAASDSILRVSAVHHFAAYDCAFCEKRVQ